MSIMATPHKETFEREVLDHMHFSHRTCIESVLDVCEKYGLAPETVGPLISVPLKEHLKVAYQELKLLPKEETNNANLFDWS